MQAALVTAAAVTLPRAAEPAAPTASGDATITAAEVQAALDRLDALIEDGMTKTAVPGTAVAVVDNDTVVYERGFGVRELGRPEPITPDTVFQVASLSKSLSSTLVAALVGDGTTTWDARIGSIETDFALADPWVSEQVTIRNMLCHRSGLPAYSGAPLIAEFHYGRDECIRRLRHYPPATSFRSTWKYSNLGFSVRAYAVARSAAKSWDDLAEARLFAPLGMTSTSYDFGRRENRAAPHFRTRAGVWKPGNLTNDDAAMPAGGVSSSLRDLTLWLRLQLASGMFDGLCNENLGQELETRSVQNNSKCVGTTQSYGAFQSQNPRNVPRDVETPRANLGTPATTAAGSRSARSCRWARRASPNRLRRTAPPLTGSSLVPHPRTGG
jgi:CubicO group peptidase (beta-lactamase class C family)